MALEKSTLENGLTIYNDHMPESMTQSIAAFIPYGSVHESSGEEGVAHALEHCVYLSTEAYPAKGSVELFARRKGIVSDAHTYFTRSVHEAHAVELDGSMRYLSQVLLAAAFRDEDVTHETKAIKREAAEALDDVDNLHTLASTYAVYGAPFGRDVLGHRRSLAFGAEQMDAVYRKVYRLGNISLVVCGMSPTEEIHMAAQRYFVQDSSENTAINQPLKPKIARGQTSGLVIKHTDNVRQTLSIPMTEEFTQNYRTSSHSYELAANLLSDACFEELREKQGLSYDGSFRIATHSHPYAWSLKASVSTDPKDSRRAEKSMRKVLTSTGENFSDDDIHGAIAELNYTYRHAATSPTSRLDGYVDELQSDAEPRDVRADLARIATIEVDDVRAAINAISEHIQTQPTYTHRTGSRKAVGDVETVVSLDEIF